MLPLFTSGNMDHPHTMKIHIRINTEAYIPSLEVDGELWFTDAEPAYDGFGTRTLGKPIKREHCSSIWDYTPKGDLRLVLIRDEHVAWQTARYQSGLNISFPAPKGDWMEIQKSMKWYIRDWLQDTLTEEYIAHTKGDSDTGS